MKATKRKFNTLLQGLSGPRRTISDDPTSSMAGLAPRPDGDAARDALMQKRRRLGLPDSIAPLFESSSAATASLSNISLGRPSAHVNKQKQVNEPPARYCPGDRDELLKRLKTFQEITDWTPKPDKVNEVEWAKRGWICQGKERVRCVLCHRELVVKFSRSSADGKDADVDVSPEAGTALEDKYAELIESSHQEECLWRKRGCDNNLLRLSFASPAATLTALRRRYDELCSRGPFLPYEFNLRLSEYVNVDDVLLKLPPGFFADSTATREVPAETPPRQSINRVALALASMGWQGLSNSRIGAVPNSASCHTCLRRLGLWMFKSKEVDESGQVLVPAPMDYLDPIREHRFFCPWKDAYSQSRGNQPLGDETEMPGWQCLLQTLNNEADLRRIYEGGTKKQGRTGRYPSDEPTSFQDAAAEAQPVAITGSPAGRAADALGSEGIYGEEGEEYEKQRSIREKERWARLRKVKSLFDTKGSKKLRRQLSRPGTAQSSGSKEAPT